MKRKLEQLAVERGIPLEIIIPTVVNEFGVVEGAKQLGYSPSTISNWLKDNGYTNHAYWAKAVAATEES